MFMAKRPASVYAKIKGKAYTRKEYMGGTPNSKIVTFDLGSKKEFEEVYSISSKERCQIRDCALEAARIAANKILSSRAGSENYRLRIHVYPHQILRENKMATGAGADRVSKGMRKAFGRAVGIAARVERDQKIISIETNKINESIAKEALRKASMKLPAPCNIR